MPIEYTWITLTPTPIVAPSWLDALAINSAATAVQAVHARETHHDQMCLYREFKNVEKALLHHEQMH